MLRNNTKNLNNNDVKELALYYYKKNDKFTQIRIRRLLSMNEVITVSDNALKEFLIKHDLEENKAFEVLNTAITTATEKKDASTLLKISQFLFEIHNLGSKTRTTVTQETDISSKIDAAKSDKITIKETRTVVE